MQKSTNSTILRTSQTRENHVFWSTIIRSDMYVSVTQYFIIFAWRGHSIGSQVHNFHIWGENWTHCFNWLKINSDLKVGQLKIYLYIYRVIFSLVPPLKVQSTEKLILARLGVSRTIYVNVDSPNLGFPYFNFLWGTSEKNHPV